MKFKVPRVWLVVSSLVFSLMTWNSLAQTPGTGAISGIVLDPSNRVVMNADVVAVNDATRLSRAVKTTSEGVFRVPLLLPGAYTVTVTVPGFSVNTSRLIQVTVSQTSSLDVRLSVAGANTSVQVSTGAIAANLESSTLGGLVDREAIQTLPLSDRNYTQILGLSPGVIADLPTATVLGRGTQNIASNGATPTANNIQFNGIDANNLAENSADNEAEDVGTAIPAPDTIEEFRVQTANYDAAYGRGSGANVDLVSRSGSNHFHGSAWEFVRNNLFNSNDFFSKLSGQARADLKQNEFGGTFGGPILHNKTFFFVAYQGITEVNGLGSEHVATLPLLTSDRSAATLGAQFCPAGHLDNSGDPASGYMTQAGGTQVACDGSNINPVALAILNAKFTNGQFIVPSPQTAIPNVGPDASDQFPEGQSTFTPPAHYREDQFSVDIDQVLNSKNTLAGRFFYSRAPTTSPFSGSGTANVPGWGTDELDQNTMLVLADTHVFNTHLVNIGRFGFTRFDGLSSVVNPLTAQAIGMSTTTGTVTATSNAPGVTAGGFTIGDAGNPSAAQVTNSFIYQDTVAFTKGKHNARFGLEFKRHEVDANIPIEVDGLLQISTFEDFLLGESAAQNGSPFGESNVSNSTAGGGLFARAERYTDFAGFAQDDIKATQHLTINVGLRYEIFGAPTEIHGELANFNPFTALQGPVPAAGTYSGFTLPANYPGQVQVGMEKTPFAGLYQTPTGDVSPRAGFVWQVFEKPIVVVRGGYGIYYDRHSGNIAEQTFTQPPFSTLQILAGAQNAAATLQAPFNPLILPSTDFPIFTPRTPTSTPFIEGTNPNLKDGLTQEYNFNVQYGFGFGYLLQVGYVGSQSSHRPGQYGFDQAILASPTSPVNGQTTNTEENAALRMPIQGVSEGSLLTDSVFIANYNSLQVSLTRQMQHGFQLQTSYTWSKNLDEVNGEVGNDHFELQLPTNNQFDLRHSSYGPAGDDRDQRLVVNFTWQVPKLSSLSKLPRYLLDNWEFSGIGLIQAGIPLSIFDGNAGSVYAPAGGVRAQIVPGVNPSTHGSLFSRVVNGPYLNGAAFTPAPEAPFGSGPEDQLFGDSGVGIVRGPGQHNLDMAIERVFPIKGGSNFRFRAEVFNLTNTPQFGTPDTSVGFLVPTPGVPDPVSSSFGRITGEDGGPHPRIIQFAAKYIF
jgi:Carboxypeptidase regulatory-like domain/TonB dependent receptor/TonB-dependent Receptor Plug Domain